MPRPRLLQLAVIALIGSFTRYCVRSLVARTNRNATAFAGYSNFANSDQLLSPNPNSPLRRQRRPFKSPTAVSPVPSETPVDDTQSSVDARVEELLSQMTLAEKIGQMTQVESDSITPDEVTAYAIGSVLTGGSGAARPNTPEGWLKRSAAYQQAALATRLAIPLIYGVDAIHGLGGLDGATLFPQNIGLGAANDPESMQRIGRVRTAEETAATGVRWNFVPVVAVVQDIRWGRTYESYGEIRPWSARWCAVHRRHAERRRFAGLRRCVDGSGYT